MENRLRNLSILVEEYQPHLLDLVSFSWINASREETESALTRIFVSIFRGLKKTRHIDLPMHMFIYHRAIRTILRSKNLPKKTAPSIKELDNDVNIEEFNPEDFRDIDIKEAFNAISPLERIVLCLNVRHKFSVDEVATILYLTPGTVLSILHKSRIKIVKHIIRANRPNTKRVPSKETKECFFTMNLESSYRLHILQKDEVAKVEKHFLRCEQCKIFYKWHNTIDELITRVEQPTLDSKINMHIFDHLEKFAFFRNLLYNLRHNWMVKVPILIILLIIAGLVSFSYCGAPNQKKQMIRYRTVPVYQTMQTQNPAQTIIEKKTSYKLTAKTIYKKSLSKKIMKLLTTMNARPISNDIDIMSSDGKMNYFNFVVDKKDITTVLDKIKKFDSFEVTEQDDTGKTGKDDIRVEVLVKINNVE